MWSPGTSSSPGGGSSDNAPPALSGRQWGWAVGIGSHQAAQPCGLPTNMEPGLWCSDSAAQQVPSGASSPSGPWWHARTGQRVQSLGLPGLDASYALDLAGVPEPVNICPDMPRRQERRAASSMTPTHAPVGLIVPSAAAACLPAIAPCPPGYRLNDVHLCHPTATLQSLLVLGFSLPALQGTLRPHEGISCMVRLLD